ncbi:MAG: hypothetical protein K2X91_02895, partial [Thermoleophilia bacterium]|nr:hypothetical protein [Thermoleophilia bacterium]
DFLSLFAVAFGAGTLFLVSILAQTLRPGAPPIEVNGREVSTAEGVRFILGFLAAWLTIGAILLYVPWSRLREIRRRRILLGADTPTEADAPTAEEEGLTTDRRRSPFAAVVGHNALDVTYEFVPDGATAPVRGSAWLRLGRIPLDPPPGPFVTPVLYLPEKPEVSQILADLHREVRIGPNGEWESPHGAMAAARLAIAGACLLGAPVLGWLVATRLL